METLLCVVIGVLVAGAVYLMLQANLLRILFGVILLGNAINLVILMAGGLTRAAPAFVAPDAKVLEGVYANPLPQALILTAIVIGMGLLAFALVLAYRAYQDLGTIDTDEMRVAEPDEDNPPDLAGPLPAAPLRREAAE